MRHLNPYPVFPKQVKDAQARLWQRERGTSNVSGPQWLVWACEPHLFDKFAKLSEILKDLRSGKWDKQDLGLLLDALAFGKTNVTPWAVEWAFNYAPPGTRDFVRTRLDEHNPDDSIELGVIAAMPFDPSSDKYYHELWTSFHGSLSSKKGAYLWYSGLTPENPGTHVIENLMHPSKWEM
jgi:hypothetical protein